MTSTPLPRVSVIVPCHNRAKYLDVFLRSLCWSSVPVEEFEVIVVDDGSEDDIETVVLTWRAMGIDLRLERITREPGMRNNAVARNVGLRLARFPIVLQTDPDIVFVSDLLASARQMMTPGELLSCSEYFPLTQESTFGLICGPEGPSDTPADYLTHAGGRPNQVLAPDGVGGLHGAFVAWRRDLIAVGGYDETFRYWGWEDRELLVTLGHAGLVRRTMPETTVVHLWHPIARGDLRRDELARAGLVSRAAWEVQMQRVLAEHPRQLRPTPRPARSGPVNHVLDATAFDAWDSSAHQFLFDAHRLEAAALQSAGHTSLARDLLRQALTRPWETAPTVSGLTHYRGVPLVLELMAQCEEAAGDHVQRNATLARLVLEADGEPVVAALQARTALRMADVATARRAATRLRGATWTPSRLALAVEISLVDGRPAEACELLTRGVQESAALGDLFETMRAVEYLRLLSRWDTGRELANLARQMEASPAGSDATEFVFSAAMRSRRDGLDLAALLLFERFLRAPGRSEERLIREANIERRAAVSRLERFGSLSPWLRPSKPSADVSGAYSRA